MYWNVLGLLGQSPVFLCLFFFLIWNWELRHFNNYTSDCRFKSCKICIYIYLCIQKLRIYEYVLRKRSEPTVLFVYLFQYIFNQFYHFIVLRFRKQEEKQFALKYPLAVLTSWLDTLLNVRRFRFRPLFFPACKADETVKDMGNRTNKI